MKNLPSKMRILTLVAVCCFLLLPAVSSADEVKVLGTVEFGPGNHTESFYLGSEAISFSAAPGLKSLSVSVQNGKSTKKSRVSSAKITLNDQVIFEPKDFNRNVSSLVKTIDVNDPGLSVVDMAVKVNGHKKASLSVTVSAVYEEAVIQIPWFLDTDVPPNGKGGPIMAMGTIDTPPDPHPLGGIWVPVGGDTQ